MIRILACSSAPGLLRAFGLSALLLGLGAGCETTVPHRTGSSVEILVDGAALEQLNPVEVAVAPIVDDTPGKSVPSKVLREAFQTALVKRRYTPLSIEFVDSRVVDAVYDPGSLGEQAVLEVSVVRWDDQLLETHGAVIVDLEARMIDPQRPEGDPLWSGRVSHRMETERSVASTQPRMLRAVCEEIAREMLSAMPARQVRIEG